MQNNNQASSTRRAVLMAGAAVAAIGGFGIMARFGRTAAAATIETKPGKVTIEKFNDAGKDLGPETVDKVVKTEAEWQKQLPPESFYVARQEGTERGLHRPQLGQPQRRALSLHLLRQRPLHQRHQVRFRHRLAELLAAHRQGQRRRDPGHHLRHDAHRRLLRALRRPSRPRLRRRAEADGAPLLHERRRHALHPAADRLSLHSEKRRTMMRSLARKLPSPSLPDRSPPASCLRRWSAACCSIRRPARRPNRP